MARCVVFPKIKTILLKYRPTLLSVTKNMAKVFAAMLSAGAYWFISGRTQETDAKLIEEHADAHNVIEQKPQITVPVNPKILPRRNQKDVSDEEESDEEESDEEDDDEGGD